MKAIPPLLFLTLLLSGILASNATARGRGDSSIKPGPVYTDTSLTFEARAANLVSMMTLKEKISQMENDAPAIPRLGIPAYNWWNECLHGVARNGIATVFPQAIGMAATWDPKLIHQEADVISTEARAKYNYAISKGEHGIYQGLTFWSPNINIDRDPRWGRNQETYGEDPYLTSTMGVAFVTGLQGNNPRYFKVISTPKHFAVHDGPEPLRHTFDAVVSNRDLYETYLPAFEACVRQGGAYSVMGAYSALDGVPDCASTFLLTDILRNKWGFKGYVVSDCGAIGDIAYGHKYTKTLTEAAAAAVKAGCDLTCGDEYQTLDKAVAEGLVSEKDIDNAVTWLMLARFKLGMFDPPAAVPYTRITIADNNTPAHMELARKVADESIVLLKNTHGTLPLRKDLKRVAVIGVYADDIEVLLGNYNGTPSNPVTILQGIRNKLGDKVDVEYAGGYNLLVDPNREEPVDQRYLKPAGGFAGHGLLAEFYDNFDLKGKPVLTRVDTSTVQYWGMGSPGKGVPKDHFSMRWTGTLTPPATGKYELGIITDDRGRIFLNGKLLVNNWRPYQLNVFKSKDVVLQKGKEYRIEIDYADSIDFAGIRFMWKRIYPQPPAEKLLADAVSLTKKSDVAIVVAGISPRLEGEESSLNIPGFKGGDRTSLKIPANQERLIKALYATGKPIILVLTGGSALAVNWEEENLPAIIDTWYPGEEGGNAVADVLFGDYNPAGRLPVTFYESAKDIPPFTDYSMQGRTYRYFKGTPLYPFGFGLSYTTFDYSDLNVSKDVAKPGDTLTVSVKVKNTGERDGDEVVQLYVKDLTSKEPQPIKSLKGFDRVSIKKGEVKTVEISLPVRSLKYYDDAKMGYVVEPGKYELQVGSSSSDIRLKRTITVD